MGQESTCSVGDAGDVDSIPGLGRSSGEGKGNPLQYSCLENIMDRGAWQATGCRNSLIQLSAYTVIPLIVCVLISSYKDTSQIGLEPILRASF